MQLSGLIPAALRDRGLARARDLARKGGVDSDALDLTAPASLRPFVVAAVAAPAEAGGAGRPVLAVTATSREADDLAEALGCLIDARPGRGLPVLGDAAARAALAALGHGRPPAGRAAPAGPPRGRRAAAGRRRAGAQLLQPQLKGLGDLEPVELTTGGERRAGGRRPPAHRHGVRPGRPGHQARRVRGARRHPGRLPADRRAPVPGRVLGRRGRGDPHLRGRRPAHHRPGRAAVGAAVPRAAAHPGGAGAGRRAGRGAPGAGRDPRQAGRGHPGRGHGVAGARAAARHRLAWSC